MNGFRRGIGLTVSLLGLLGCVAQSPGDDEDVGEPEPESIGTSSDALSSLSCQMSNATGYKSGSPFNIEVVTVDGKKVEWKTANAYMKMAAAAANAGVQIHVVSGFRTMAEQQYLYSCFVSCNCNGCNLAAKPGYSNHQSGHALDLNTSTPGVYAWLSSHGGSFGFHRTVPSEAWHWEWWGQDDGSGPCNDDDKDNDGVEDDKDNCPNVKNAGQLDTDHDDKGDACDNDDDGDGLKDKNDNCPKKKNAGQLDTDHDGKGDACDSDDDGDKIKDAKDNCPKEKNHGQLDTDGDGQGDACDDDDDGDGLSDAQDDCPKKKNPGQLDSDGDGKGDACQADDDGDGFPDDADNCPKVSNPEQDDTDGDGDGDACDEDDDGDGVVDSGDVCPLDIDPEQADADADGLGDVCDDDDDMDGVPDDEDLCPTDGDPDQLDTDDDGLGDACDDDDDGDGILDTQDGCPDVANSDEDPCAEPFETAAPPELGPADAPSDSSGCSVDGRRGDRGAAGAMLGACLAMAILRRRRSRTLR